MRANRFYVAAFVLALSPVSSFAQAKVPASSVAIQTLEDGYRYRAELAAAIGAGETKPTAALARLRAQANAMGANFSPELDFSSAALDIGQRLVTAGHGMEAELFFSSSEESLGAAIDRAPDEKAEEKAQLLELRAFVRDSYLNESPGADADLRRASELLPNDKRLRRKRDLLPEQKTGRKRGENQEGGK